MDWKPISEDALWGKINAAEALMEPPQLRLWNFIRVTPKKWKLEPYGAAGGGFWVVAIVGTLVVWYNDIEEGFNVSGYREFGEIGDYWCNQDELNETMASLHTSIQDGRLNFVHASAPRTGEFPC